MQRLLFLAVAGALGALARYGLVIFVQRQYVAVFPWGTFTVNTLGCFMFGLVWSIAEDRLLISDDMRLILLTGFIGAFTTFSTFMFESSQLMRDAEWMLTAGNILGQTILGLSLMFAGLALGRLL